MILTDVNYCDEETQMPGSPADILPKKTNFYALRKVTCPYIILYLLMTIITRTCLCMFWQQSKKGTACSLPVRLRIVPRPGRLTIVLQCYDAVRWVVFPVKLSPKWSVMCEVEYQTLLYYTARRAATVRHWRKLHWSRHAGVSMMMMMLMINTDNNMCCHFS